MQQTPPREWRPENGFTDLWRFTGPMPRSRYQIVVLPFLVVAVISTAVFLFTLGLPTKTPWWMLAAVALVPALVAMPWTIAAHVRRWRELGHGPGWVVLNLLPGIGVLTLLYQIRAQGDSDLGKSAYI